MSKELQPNIWFVRSNGGSGSYPVTPAEPGLAPGFHFADIGICCR